MIRISFLFSCLVFTSVGFSARTQNIARVKANIDTLASSDFHGRGYVLNGEKKAANFISSNFKRFGLKAFEDNYFQRLQFNANTFPNKVSLKIDGKKLETGKDFIVNPISGSGSGSGKIIYLDTLIFDSEAARFDFLHKDFRKNIMVYQSRSYGDLIQLPIQYLDHLHNSLALIELQEKKLTASVAGNQLSHPAFEILKGTISAKAKKASFRLDADLIKNYKTQNVIGYVEGKTNPDSFVVISAHYDHLGMMGKNAYFPGANDNASGIAMLLELADYFSKPENQQDFSICFMAFTGEEMGLLGSKHYTLHPEFPLSQIKYLINMDMVGTGDEGATIVNTSDNPEELALFQKINQEKNYLPKVNKRANAPNSDHYYFTRNGVKAFFIYALGGIKAYHDIYDRPETLPLTKFEGVFGLVKDFIIIKK